MSNSKSNEPRTIAVPKYFRKTPKKPKKDKTDTNNVKIIIGGIVVVVGLFLIAINDTLGLMAIAGGGAYILRCFWDNLQENKLAEQKYAKAMEEYQEKYKEAEPKPSDQQMDEWLRGDIEKLTQNALQELDLDQEQVQQKPIVVIGPSHNAAIAIGKDGIVRFSQYDIVIVFLTEYHLAAYNATLNMSTGTPIRESTQEYHYSDIVSVFTKTESSRDFVLIYRGTNKKLPVYKEFSLSVASGEKIRVVVPFDSPEFLEIFESEGYVNIKIPETGADKAVRLIRARLREKKGGTHV